MVNVAPFVYDDGAVTDMPPVPTTLTDQSAYTEIQVLHGETVADVAKRVYGANSELNRDRIRANSREPKPGDRIKVANI